MQLLRLELKGFKSFADKTIVKFSPGMTAVIGPNGSGKSTFLKCVYRVQRQTEGKIFFNGQDLDELSYRESALKLAVVAQHNAYSFDFSVLDIVLMVLPLSIIGLKI